MCEPVSIATAAVTVVSSISNSNNQNKAWAATEEARRKQNIEMVRQSNIQDANLKVQDMSNFEKVRQEMENATLDAIKAQGSVQVAVNESNLEGRTVDRVVRDVENVQLRTKGMINENYERDYLNIYTQRESNRNQLIGALTGSQAAMKPSKGGQILDAGVAGVQGYLMGDGLNKIITSTPDAKLFGSSLGQSNRTP